MRGLPKRLFNKKFIISPFGQLRRQFFPKHLNPRRKNCKWRIILLQGWKHKPQQYPNSIPHIEEMQRYETYIASRHIWSQQVFRASHLLLPADAKAAASLACYSASAGPQQHSQDLSQSQLQDQVAIHQHPAKFLADICEVSG